jgi:predicted nuclease with TOPRIM domain
LNKKARHTSDSEDVKPIVETKIVEKVVEVESEAMKAKLQRYKAKVRKLEEENAQLQQRNAELASQAGEYKGEVKGLEAQVALLKSLMPSRNLKFVCGTFPNREFVPDSRTWFPNWDSYFWKFQVYS